MRDRTDHDVDRGQAESTTCSNYGMSLLPPLCPRIGGARGNVRAVPPLGGVAAAALWVLTANAAALVRLSRPAMPGAWTYAHAALTRAALETAATRR